MRIAEEPAVRLLCPFVSIPSENGRFSASVFSLFPGIPAYEKLLIWDGKISSKKTQF
ncbi:MAG: hypothetical protein GX171_09180 [Clostridiales bacterium]|nr:hypothetical protein [Clostridiales bacterium]